MQKTANNHRARLESRQLLTDVIAKLRFTQLSALLVFAFTI